MNKKLKFIIYAAVFVLIVIGAVLLYNYLSTGYVPEDKTPSASGKTPTSTTENVSSVETAPDFTVSDLNGNEVHLSDYKGKPIVINFWATWCSPCKMELPDFQSAYEKYGDDIVFMMINLTDGYRDTVDTVKEFCNTNGYTFPVFFDTQYTASEAYSAYSIPTTVAINIDGEIIDTRIGTMSSRDIESLMETLIKNNR